MKRLLHNFMRYRKRLHSLGIGRSLYYIVNVIYGETFRRRAPGTFGLRMVDIGATNDCQCRCPHCYAAYVDAAAEASELSTTEIRSVIDQASDMGAMEICFSGGEPLLREDIIDLIAHARKRKMVPKINTNGILLSEEMVKKLKAAGLAWCMVSIDHADPGPHDAFRGYRNCYAKAIVGLKELVRERIPSGITTVARKETIRGGALERIVSLGHELELDSVRILYPVLTGGYRDAYEKVLSDEERAHVRKLLKDPLVSMEYESRNTTCTAGITKLNIQANGDVTPCVFIPVVFGNVRCESLREIWRRMDGFARLEKPRGQCPLSDPSFKKKVESIRTEMERRVT